MGYWFGKRIKDKRFVASLAEAQTLMSKGWVPIVFADFSNNIDSIALIKI